MKNKNFSIKQRIKSFAFAFNGVKIIIREEHNARIQLCIACLVIIAGFVFSISQIEWILIVFGIGLVFSMETLNTAIENLADFVCPEKHFMIKKIKDISAAGVLISAIIALIVGTIIFVPKILNLC